MSQQTCSGKSIDQYYLLAASALRDLGANITAQADMMERHFAKELGPLDRGVPCVTDYLSKLAAIHSQLSRYNMLCDMNIEDAKTKAPIMPQADYDELMK